jgi:cysteine desulfurase
MLEPCGPAARTPCRHTGQVAATTRVYLDHASAAPCHPAALAAAEHVARELPGDPSRRHGEGRAARDLLEQARAAVAAAFAGAPERVVFTSGGTESVHLAVLGAAAANRRRPRRILSTAVEHSAVLAAAEASGYETELVAVDAHGRLRLDALEQLLAGGAALVNVQHANHEVGTVQPVSEVAALCREHDVLLHVDACQTAGRLAVSLDELGADFLSVSGAKLGAARGIGALLWSPRARFSPLLRGDEREHRRRAGLENLPGAAALAETLLRLDAGEAQRCDRLRRRMRAALPGAVEDLQVHGPAEGTAPHIVALSALYVDGEALVTALDEAGFAVHSGSSCATTSGEPSHVLVAMGALTHGHVRASVGPGVAEEEVDAFTGALAEAVARLRTTLVS